MITRSAVRKAQARAADMLQRAGIVLTPSEARNIEVAEFGLGELESTSLEVVVYVNTDRSTGQSKGFGFVEMASNEEAQAAIQALNGKDLNGRVLTVNEAKPREDRGGGGGRRGGGGGYGGGGRGGRY